MTDSTTIIAAGRHPAGSVTATPIVAWDLDGTLTRSDTLIPFLSRVLGPAQLARSMARVTRRVGIGPGWRASGKAALLHDALAGRDFGEVDRIAARYAAELLARRLRVDSLRRWEWHRRQGHRLLLASASPDLYVWHLGAVLGAHGVISTELEIVDRVLTGRLSTPNCRGAEKARRLRGYLADHPGGQFWMYADSFSDLPSLALADVPVRVRPYRWLRTPGTAPIDYVE